MFVLCSAGECNPLKPPRNGDVKFTSTLIGSIANYECFEGFSLEGEEIRTCIDGGTQGGIWTGNDPTCNRKSHCTIFPSHLLYF